MVEIYLGVVTHWAFWVVLIGCGAFYGIQKQFEVPKLKALHQRPFDALRDYYVFLIFAVGGLVLVGTYWMYLHDIMWSVHVMVGRLRALADAPTGDDFAETLNNLAQGSALLLGVLAATATLSFTLLRTWINERTTRATEEGLITDRINAAVASLGADKTVKGFKDGTEYTRPNIEVRVGAILALERIARMNDSVHIQIMEILCAYVRENTKHEFKRASKDRPDRSEPFYRQIPRNDLQLAIRVIGRRSKRQIDIEYSIRFRLDFANCDLSGFHFLSKGNFCGAIFENCVLEASEFRDVKLNGARFTDSYLGYVNFLGSDLTGCNLNHTKMKKTQLKWANTFYGALIAGADLSGSDFPGTPEETNTIFGT